MSSATVENVKEIQALTEEMRELLEADIARIDEEKWQEEAVQARQIARDAGNDQTNIDQAIERIRHQ